MERAMMNPQKGEVYTLQPMLTKLDLPDTPSLHFMCQAGERIEETVLQTGHVSRDQLLSVPGLAATRWRFLYITWEWIPIFACREAWSTLKTMIDVEGGDDEELLWATPKGFPRENPSGISVNIDWDAANRCTPQAQSVPPSKNSE